MTAKPSMEDFLNRLYDEKNVFNLIETLRKITEFETVPLNSHIVNLISHRNRLVRNFAVEALSKCNDKQVETVLLDRAGKIKDHYDLTHINVGLINVGTERSIPYLLEMVNHKKNEVVTTALAALSAIQDRTSRSFLPLYVEKLEKGNGHIKYAAMKAIHRHGGKSETDEVFIRIRNILKRKRKAPQYPVSELIFGLEFLWRMKNYDNRIDNFFNNVLPQKWHMLFDYEASRINNMLNK